MNLRNGYIVKCDSPEDSFLLWGEADRTRGFVAKGYTLQAPNIENASKSYINDLYMDLANLVAKTPPNTRLQFRWSVDSDYSIELERYKSETERLPCEKWDLYERQRVYSEFKNKMDNRELRRERLSIYISKPMADFSSKFFTPNDKKDVADFKKMVSQYFDQQLSTLKERLKSVKVSKMTCQDMFIDLYKTLNKSALFRTPDYDSLFDDSVSILDSCLRTGYSGVSETDKIEERSCCFVADGFFHNMLYLSKMPIYDSEPFLANRKLIDNDLNGYAVIINFKPKDNEKYIEKKQIEYGVLTSNLDSDPKEISLKSSLEELDRNIQLASKGESIPFDMDYFIHIWDDDLKRLQNKTLTLRNSVDNMDGADVSVFEVGAQSLKAFEKTLPGNIFYKDWRNALEVFHYPAVNLIPLSSTFVGSLKEAMAIFEGDKKNIIGISTFHGGSPSHTGLFGQSGSGKSVNMLSILTQSYAYYSKIVIIEDGASYLGFTQAVGGQYLPIAPNSNISINYYDTFGLPLSPDHKSFICNVLTEMCGVHNPDLRRKYRSCLMPYVQEAFELKYKEFIEDNPEIENKIAKIGLMCNWIIPHLPTERQNLFDSYIEVRDTLNLSIEEGVDCLDHLQSELIEFQDVITDEMIESFIDEHEEDMIDIGAAFFKSTDFPLHREIVDTMLHAPKSFQDHDTVKDVANILRDWRFDGPYGKFFDNYTNIDFSNKLILFELGLIQDSDKEIRTLIGLIISNVGRKIVVSGNRRDYKLFIFEEIPRFLIIESGPEIVKQSWAQFRKYNCCPIAISQQMAQLFESNVFEVIMNQSKQFWLLKNRYRKDLDRIAEFVQIPENTKDAIQNYVLPKFQTASKKSSSFCLYIDSEAAPEIGTAKNFASEEMLYLASTDGNSFEQRQREFREIEGIVGKNADFIEKMLYVLKHKKSFDSEVDNISTALNEIIKIVSEDEKQDIAEMVYQAKRSMSKALKTNRLFKKRKQEKQESIELKNI